MKLSPSSAIAEFNWGGALMDMNRLSEAIPHFRRAIELVPNYSDAHYFLGQASEATGHPDEAEQEYRKVIESKDFYPLAHESLGLLLASRKEFVEAIDQFKLAVQSDPEFLQGYINLASACAADRRYQEAIEHGTDALKLAQSQGDIKAVEGLNARLKFYRDRLAGVPENTPCPSRRREVVVMASSDLWWRIASCRS